MIFKTDLRDSTPLFRSISQERLAELLSGQKDLVSRLVLKHGGQIVKGEGDAFWITFPSVTAAAQAGVEIQQELRASQPGISDDQRLALRIVIALGDVLHQSGDIFGYPVNLAARMEKIAPADEIYLSQAAWLALNPAEVETEYVGEFSFKGVAQPERIYRVVASQHIQVIADQAILVADLKRFSIFQKTFRLEDMEAVLAQLERLIKAVCRANTGVVREGSGDAFILTFSEAAQAVQAASDLCQQWDEFAALRAYPPRLSVGIHYGEMFAFGIYLFGEAINTASLLETLDRYIHPEALSSHIVLSGALVERLPQGDRTPHLRLVDPAVFPPNIDLHDQRIYCLD